MAVVRVTDRDQSKAGKDRVYFDGKTGWENAYYVSAKCAIPDVGMTIEADTTSSEFKGKTYWYLNKWKEVKGSLPTVNAPAKVLAGWAIPDGDLSRYASNIVASAITAGLIKEPHQLVAWAAAAYTSGNSLREGAFARKLPMELADMPDPTEDHSRDDDDDFSDDVPF